MIPINQNSVLKKKRKKTTNQLSLEQALLFSSLSQSAWSFPRAGHRFLLTQPVEKQSFLLKLGGSQPFAERVSSGTEGCVDLTNLFAWNRQTLSPCNSWLYITTLGNRGIKQAAQMNWSLCLGEGLYMLSQSFRGFISTLLAASQNPHSEVITLHLLFSTDVNHDDMRICPKMSFHLLGWAKTPSPWGAPPHTGNEISLGQTVKRGTGVLSSQVKAAFVGTYLF